MPNTLTEALQYANNKRTISNSIKRDLPSAPKLYPSYLEYRINNKIVRYDLPRYNIPHYQQPLQQLRPQLRQSLYHPRRQLQRPPSYTHNLMFPMYQQQQPQQQQQQQPNVDQFCRSYGYKKIVPEAPKLIRRVSKNKSIRNVQSIRPIQKQQPIVLQIKPHDNQQTNRTQMYYKTPNKSKSPSKSPNKYPNKSKSPNKSPNKTSSKSQ